MTEISIYHLTVSSLEQFLPKLLEKIIGSGRRALVLAASEERVESLNNILWTYSPGSFLPHGTFKDGFAEHQPIWLSTSVEGNSNSADVLVLTDSMEALSLTSFKRCVDIFDGRDEEASMLAKKRIQHYNNNGHEITYWFQQSKGTWETKTDF